MTKEEAIYLLRNTAWLAPSGTLESVEEAVDMATEALKAGAEMSLPKWIPCSERLPEAQFEGQRRGYYLTTNANGGVGETRYEFYHDFMKTGWQSDFRIVAWMPLPAPYGGESNG